MRSEAELIRFLRSKFPAGGDVRVGIDDDAAVLRGEGRHDWVVTTDLLVEGVHFLRGAQPPQAVGWKSLARSLSDCAAMGAEPRFALVALAFPPSTAANWIDDFFTGFARLARRHRVRLAGGDLAAAPQIVADVQVIGQMEKRRAVLRSGARPGDLVFVSGRLGLSGLGLACLRHHVASVRPLIRRALRAHSFPEPRVRLARALVRRGDVTAMIDLSDGLSTDLHHLCEASRVGARVLAEKIPAVPLPPSLARRLRTSGRELALNAGEDYELLFTVPARRAAQLPKKLAGVSLSPIGQIIRTQRVILVEASGRERALAPGGWDHFRSRAQSDSGL